MNLEAVSGAATVAIACSIVFLVAASIWHFLARSLASHPEFPGIISREAAQRFRDEFERLSRKQSAYVGAGVMFLVIFAVAYTFEARRLYSGYPVWQLRMILVVLALAVAFAVYKSFKVAVSWRHVRLLRDANIAVGHALQHITSGRGRVYHDVTTNAGVVDHVVVGPSGVYAVNVVAKRGLRRGTVRLENNQLHFSAGKRTISLSQIAAKTTRLEHDIRKLLRDSLRVRSVIVTPGWEVTDPVSEGHLVVNETTLPQFDDWHGPADYLLDEDVEALQQQLTANSAPSTRLRLSLRRPFR